MGDITKGEQLRSGNNSKREKNKRRRSCVEKNLIWISYGKFNRATNKIEN